MPNNPSFDVIVIGAGSAGFAAAEAARAAGAKVGLVEKSKLGGECPNWACVPSKALLRTAKALRAAKEMDSFGVSVSGAQASFQNMMAYRASVVKAVTGGGEKGDRYVRLAEQLGVELVYGEAAFLDANVIEVAGQRLFAKAFVIATGTTEFVPEIPGLADMRYFTSKDAVLLERQPKALAIIGGGPVGCELATFFQTIGTRVVLLQSASTILHREDGEIARLAQEQLAARGVEVIVNAEVTEIINARGGVYGVRARSGGEERMHAVEGVLLAAGRHANVAGLHPEAAGVILDARGSISTNAKQTTKAPHVFAAGDVDGGFQFTHTAHREGAVAGHNAALFALGKKGPGKRMDSRVVPRVTFVDPEVASVGLTEDEARAEHQKILVGRSSIAALGRAVTDHARTGLVKIIAHPKTRQILGCHIMAERAGEMIHEPALAMQLEAPVDILASLIHAYPTYNEAIGAAAASVTLQ